MCIKSSTIRVVGVRVGLGLSLGIRIGIVVGMEICLGINKTGSKISNRGRTKAESWDVPRSMRVASKSALMAPNKVRSALDEERAETAQEMCHWSVSCENGRFLFWEN